MKKIILLLLFPFIIFSQESVLIGDVDCNGVVNSEDGALILQYVTSVIESLPCEENVSGLTVEQLNEMVEIINNQLIINYGGVSFGDWILKYNDPSFDYIIYGQEQSDGFLMIQYSRANDSNSSSSFGFNIYTGENIDTVDFIMDVSINIKNSWNPIDSKIIPIKKGDYWVLEDNDGTSVDKVYFLPINGDVNISEDNLNTENNTQESINKGIMFPEGYPGSPISWNLNTDNYLVPDNHNLYITQYHNTEQSEGLFIENNDGNHQISKGRSNYIYYTGIGFSPTNTNNMPIIVGSGETISGSGSFSGFLTQKVVNPLTLSVDGDSEDNWSGDFYQVPDDKVLYLLQCYGDDDSALLIDDVVIVENYSNNIFYTGVGFTPAMTLSMPILAGPGQVVTGAVSINGYLADLNYFSQ